MIKRPKLILKKRHPKRRSVKQKIMRSLTQGNMVAPKGITFHYMQYFTAAIPLKANTPSPGTFVSPTNDIVKASSEAAWYANLYDSFILEKVKLTVVPTIETSCTFWVGYDEKPGAATAISDINAFNQIRNKRYLYHSLNNGPQTFWFNLSNVGKQPQYDFNGFNFGGAEGQTTLNAWIYGYFYFLMTGVVAGAAAAPLATTELHFTVYGTLGNPKPTINKPTKGGGNLGGIGPSWSHDPSTGFKPCLPRGGTPHKRPQSKMMDSLEEEFGNL